LLRLLAEREIDDETHWRCYLRKSIVEVLGCFSTCEHSGGNLRSYRGSDEGGVPRHSPIGPSFLDSTTIGGLVVAGGRLADVGAVARVNGVCASRRRPWIHGLQ
jgi:hypothetical protein